MRIVLLIATLLASPCFAENPPASDTWPQWRGPTRDGKVGGAAWPNSLKADRLKLRWRVDQGESYAGPIVAGDAIYTVETKDRKKEIARALDRKTGEEKWNLAWDGSMTVPFFAARNGNWVRSTPALDGDRLYVAGMRDVLVCVDAKSGKERWRVDFVERFKASLPTFGFVCSPLIVGDAVYVQAGAGFVKLNKMTGETIWRTLDDGGGMNGSAFASPSFATIAGKPQMLVQTRTLLAGVELDKGQVLWQQKIEAFRGMNILTPLAYDNTVLTSSYGGRTLQLKIDQADGRFSATQAWDNRTQGYMTSPVIIDDHGYFLGRNKRFHCVALGSGEVKWTSEKTYCEYWSLVAQGDKILGLDQRGILYLIKATPEKFEVLDERKISEQETWAHLAVVGNELFVRELKGMMVWEWK